jgi:tRNA(Ile)-lysidine synthase
MRRLPRDHHRLLERFTASMGEDVCAAPRLLLAVSGGADSMALLELAVLARGARAGSDVAVYVDHGLRAQTGEEAEHVRAAASRLGTGFALAKLADGTGPDERRLRDARYAELQRLAASHNADFVLTGHTRDDQIETVLHRLVRGAGRHGLAGIPERRGNVLRPLLGFGRDELRRFLRDRAIGWCEDPSNDDILYLRNRLRHRVIPAIEAELGRGALDHLPALASAWREEEAYLQSEAGRYAEFVMVGSAASPRLDVRALRAVPAALRSRIVRAWLAERTGRPATSFSRAESAAILALAETPAGTRRIALDRLIVVNVYGTLDIATDAETAGGGAPPFRFEVPTRADARITGPGGWVIEVANLEAKPLAHTTLEPRTGANDRGDFDRALLGETLIVRSGLPGDRLRARASGHRKVSDLMIDARIPSEHRASWPVVEAKGRIVWVPGVARSEDFAAASAEAASVRLTWRRELA